MISTFCCKYKNLIIVTLAIIIIILNIVGLVFFKVIKLENLLTVPFLWMLGFYMPVLIIGLQRFIKVMKLSWLKITSNYAIITSCLAFIFIIISFGIFPNSYELFIINIMSGVILGNVFIQIKRIIK